MFALIEGPIYHADRAPGGASDATTADSTCRPMFAAARFKRSLVLRRLRWSWLGIGRSGWPSSMNRIVDRRSKASADVEGPLSIRPRVTESLLLTDGANFKLNPADIDVFTVVGMFCGGMAGSASSPSKLTGGIEFGASAPRLSMWARRASCLTCCRHPLRAHA